MHACRHTSSSQAQTKELNPLAESADQNHGYEDIEVQLGEVPGTEYIMSNCPAYESQNHNPVVSTRIENALIPEENEKPKHAA